MHTILVKNEIKRVIDVDILLPDCCDHISSYGSWQRGDAGAHNICVPKKEEKTFRKTFCSGQEVKPYHTQKNSISKVNRPVRLKS